MRRLAPQNAEKATPLVPALIFPTGSRGGGFFIPSCLPHRILGGRQDCSFKTLSNYGSADLIAIFACATPKLYEDTARGELAQSKRQ
jgi:hypothetical protein